MARPVLDSDQQRAAAHRKGPAAVAAVAGSGKTTMLVGRAIALVESGAAPESVVTLAFNRNAAQTLRDRLRENPATRGHEAAMASTFHAFALGICKQVNPNIAVAAGRAEEDAGKQTDASAPDVNRRTTWDMARDAFRAIGGYERGASRPEFLQDVDVDALMEVEPGLRERLFAFGWPDIAEKPADLRAAFTRLTEKGGLKTNVSVDALMAFMPAYRKVRAEARLLDFTDMLVALGTWIRRQHPKVMTRLAQIKHLQVDEAQDGNELRWFIARAVLNLGGDRSVMAVGDLRQSIAGFAGAEPALFRAWWDESTQFSLPRNYRSASRIVAAGNAVAHGESWNIGGDAIAVREDLGLGSVRIAPIGPLSIANEIATALNEKKLGHKDVTVLARTRAALETTAFGLRTRGIKVIVRGGGNAWRSADGKAILAYLNLADALVPDKRAAASALNKPFRYISAKKLDEWVNAQGQVTRMLYAAAANYRPAQAVVDVITTLAEQPWEQRCEQVRDWLHAGMDEDAANNGDSPGSESDRGDLIASLCGIAGACRDMNGLQLAIAADQKLDPKDPDVVELSTIHQSKGDQWSTVYLTAVKDKVFPHMLASDDEEVAEETRLLYVAVTRPVSDLIIDVHDDVAFASKLRAIRVAVDAAKAPGDARVTTPAEDDGGEDEDEPAPASKFEEAACKACGTTFTRDESDRGFPTWDYCSSKCATPKSNVVPFDRTPKPQGPTYAEALAAVLARIEAAHQLTSESKNRPAEGERFVNVEWQEFATLLGPLGFVEGEPAGQRVAVLTLADGAQVRIYTTVPRGAERARSSGEDSIKFVLLGSNGKPIAGKQPFAARTVNWRVTVLNRLADLLGSKAKS